MNKKAEAKEIVPIEVPGTLEVTHTPTTFIELIGMAIEQNSGIEQLEKLMALQERYEANEAKKAYVVAMNAFRSECPSIIKTKEAYNNKYAGLAETIEQIKELLAKCGLSHSWKINDHEKGVSVTCYVTHVAGHQESTTMSAPPDTGGKKNPIQEIASTVSYLERYTLYAILGLASIEMDNDGQTEAEYITPDQLEIINKIIEDKKVDLSMFLDYMAVETLDKIDAKDYKKAEMALDKAHGGKK